MRAGIFRGLLWSATDRTDASTSSVLRFYAVIWAAQAIVVGRAAAREHLDHEELRGISWLMAAGGAARALAWWRSGPPHPLFRALTMQELTMPIIVRLLR